MAASWKFSKSIFDPFGFSPNSVRTFSTLFFPKFFTKRLTCARHTGNTGLSLASTRARRAGRSTWAASCPPTSSSGSTSRRATLPASSTTLSSFSRSTSCRGCATASGTATRAATSWRGSSSAPTAATEGASTAPAWGRGRSRRSGARCRSCPRDVSCKIMCAAWLLEGLGRRNTKARVCVLIVCSRCTFQMFKSSFF